MNAASYFLAWSEMNDICHDRWMNEGDSKHSLYMSLRQQMNLYFMKPTTCSYITNYHHAQVR